MPTKQWANLPLQSVARLAWCANGFRHYDTAVKHFAYSLEPKQTPNACTIYK